MHCGHEGMFGFYSICFLLYKRFSEINSLSVYTGTILELWAATDSLVSCLLLSTTVRTNDVQSKVVAV